MKYAVFLLLFLMPCDAIAQKKLQPQPELPSSCGCSNFFFDGGISAHEDGRKKFIGVGEQHSFPHHYIQNFPAVGIGDMTSYYWGEILLSSRAIFYSSKFSPQNYSVANRQDLIPLSHELLYFPLNFYNNVPKGKVKKYSLSRACRISGQEVIFGNNQAKAQASFFFDTNGAFLERISHTSIVDTVFSSPLEESYYKIADLKFYFKHGATRLNIVERSPSREYYQYQRFDYENMYGYSEDSAMQIIRKKKAKRSETMFIELLSDSACQKWERAYFAVYQDSKTDKLIRVKEVHYSYGEKIDTQRHYVYVPYFVPLQKEMPQPTEAYCWHCLADTAAWQLLFTTLHDKEGNLLVWEHTYWIAKIQRLHACFFCMG